jgi:hypothetical protein
VANSERRHPSEDALLAFLSRKDQSAGYVRDVAEWVKAVYPGSAARLIPKIREIYREKRRGQ